MATVIDKSKPAKVKKNVEEYTRTRAQALGGVIFLIVVICFNICFIYSLYSTMTKVDTIPINKIQVEGDLSILTKSDIEQYYLKNPKPYNLITLDLAEVKAYLERHPWIRSVMLKKRLPDILMIYVIEHKPLAYYNQGILTSQWNVIYPDLNSFKKNLVVLKGPKPKAKDEKEKSKIDEKNAQYMYERYRNFKIILETSGFYIKEVKLSDTYIWSILLENGIWLKLGRDGDIIDQYIRNDDVLLSRLKLFVEAYPHLENKDLIEYIDLRYDSGMAVRLKEIEKQK